MDLKKYSELRGQIYEKTFEQKYRDVNKWLMIFSYFGNIGSIFFAFFLVYPALNKAIAANLMSGDFATYLSGLITVMILAAFELLKRKVLSNLSFDIVRNKFKITNSIIGWLVFSFSFIGASFYFSLNGAINFAETSKEKNVIIETNITNQIDSITNVYEQRKQVLIEDNNGYRESNKEYRDKISDTPLNYRTVRRELQDLVEANLEAISENEERISNLNDELSSIISKLEKEQKAKKEENQDEDLSNIFLFLIISTSIEVIIILGVFFHQYYQFHVFVSHMNDLELVFRKRERYKTMIKFIYKEGILGVGELVMGKSKLVELIKEKSTKIVSPSKFVDDFFTQMEFLGIIELNGTRRVLSVSYEEALNKIENFDDILRLLEKLD